ncbi:small acid-soluble spore protein Tlp [Sporolactobacillus inulinus]|jgi:small acid-soluble spore protein (thioredoxin-like protein)|uniref:Small, acid-soluble spore protein tlp n=2 Tax=Sporolactobacillus inulinus TaxID=2078 RepID=A0A4Y1Z9F4_9BACL|nr:small acid-soluble spore protein Tlp [Sporolactobacillus inulinus]KLI01494.1 spore protein [Sporolactobacillus inulinus CASD]GAY75679.1 small, acid-soluble spore protein tlp [Sporolactobacillus inulinus]GEB77313.1 protein Tlp [Sporolactobacillus inulinus]
MAKPDDRSDNWGKIAHNIGNTLQNINETEDYLKAHGDKISEDEKRQLLEKNQRRAESVHGLREEIKDEARFSKTH